MKGTIVRRQAITQDFARSFAISQLAHQPTLPFLIIISPATPNTTLQFKDD